MGVSTKTLSLKFVGAKLCFCCDRFVIIPTRISLTLGLVASMFACLRVASVAVAAAVSGASSDASRLVRSCSALVEMFEPNRLLRVLTGGSGGVGSAHRT